MEGNSMRNNRSDFDRRRLPEDTARIGENITEERKKVLLDGLKVAFETRCHELSEQRLIIGYQNLSLLIKSFPQTPLEERQFLIAKLNTLIIEKRNDRRVKEASFTPLENPPEIVVPIEAYEVPILTSKPLRVAPTKANKWSRRGAGLVTPSIPADVAAKFRLASGDKPEREEV